MSWPVGKNLAPKTSLQLGVQSMCTLEEFTKINKFNTPTYAYWRNQRVIFFAKMPQKGYQARKCATVLVTQFHRTGFLSSLSE